MAWSSFLRRSACAAPLTIRALGSPIEQSGAISALDLTKRSRGRRLLGAECPPSFWFSTNPVTDASLQQTVGKSPDRSSPFVGSPTLTCGLPHGYNEVRYEKGTLFLTRKSMDEIIQVEVSVNTEYVQNRETARMKKYCEMTSGEKSVYDFEGQHNEEEAGDILCLKMKIKILYSEGFNKGIELDTLVFPGDRDQVAIRRVRMSATHDAHLEEFEEFLKKRGIESRNLNFLFDHIQKLEQLYEGCNTTVKEVPPKA